MVLYETYSKRRQRELGAASDVYQYETIPHPLRVQIIHIWGDAIGIPYVTVGYTQKNEDVQGLYHTITQILRREYGVFSLFGNADPNDKAAAYEELKRWFLSETSADRVLDAIELAFTLIRNYCSRSNYIHREGKRVTEDAISELNARFKENGVGFQFEDKLVRVDSQFIHAEAVVPALTVLRRPEYANAQSEFLSAFEHFRHGNKEESLVDCCKCIESTLKIICAKRNWSHDANRATLSELVRISFENGLIPTYWQTHFNGLRSVLESSVATPRNRQGGHGAGVAPAPLPEELVSYVLHMTAATILFLTESEASLPL